MQLSRDITVTQKTAWFMLQRMRNCFGISDEKFNNQGEIDETYVGGANANKSLTKRKELHKNGMQTGANHKTPVLGILERKKRVGGIVINKAHQTTIQPIIFNKINKSATVITDGFGAYNNIEKYFKKHVILNH